MLRRELEEILTHASFILYNRQRKSIFDIFDNVFNSKDIEYIIDHWND